jgi:hypothetical protein
MTTNRINDMRTRSDIHLWTNVYAGSYADFRRYDYQALMPDPCFFANLQFTTPEKPYARTDAHTICDLSTAPTQQ